MTYADALRHHVERSLRRDLELPAVSPDGDDDYGVVVGDLVVWTRPMLDREPALLRVWTPAVQGVKKSAALLTELNDLNLGFEQLRCVLFGQSVLVFAEAEIESLEQGELGRLVTHVGEAAERVGLMIAAVYGGERVLVTADADAEAGPAS